MPLPEALTALTDEIQGSLIEKEDGYLIEVVLAERRSFLSRKRLVYRARLRIDETRRELTLAEHLKETGLGWGAGSEEAGITPGIGFKKDTYRVGLDGVRRGTITEQSDLFGKKYQYRFDFNLLREKIRRVGEADGYTFVLRGL
jgi:hypothetical protein